MLRTHALAIFILIGHLCLFFVFNLFVNPHPDMLDHWVWSRYLSLSYYEHPPMIAWAIRAITMVLGHSEIALEFGAQLYNLLILGLFYSISYQLFGKLSAIFSLILLESTPYFTLGSLFLHIDQPFLIFWLINLYLLCRFHQNPSSRRLILIGIIAGLGGLSKYIMLLFYMGLFIHLILYKKCRYHLQNVWLYLAGILSLVVFTPVILWNYQNHWISFRFQFDRGLSGAEFGSNFIYFTLGHLFLFSLIWSGWSLYNLWVQRNDFQEGTHSESIILVLSLFPMIFFSLMSFRGSIADPHWVNIAYLGFMMLGGKTLADHWKTGKRSNLKRMISGGLLLNFGIILLLLIHIQTPLVDLSRYQLKYFSALERQGLPSETIEKLEPLKDSPLLSKEEFIKRLQPIITPEEFNQYQTPILQVARKTEYDLVTRFIAWNQTAHQIQNILENRGYDLPDYIISKEFQLSSALSFYFPNHPFPYSLQKPERNQWSNKEDMINKKVMVVCTVEDCSRVIRNVKEKFKKDIRYLGIVSTYSHHRLVRELELYRLH